MTSSTIKRFRWGAALLATTLTAGAAAAQPQTVQSFNVGGVVPAPYSEDASSVLARHIRTLATSPKNLPALLGAGNAAIEVGDMQAALAFFARAEEVAPQDGRVKAGMGSVFVQSEQPEAALKFFSDAAALGAPVAIVARDRGLAYDMIGQPLQAQAEYALALRSGSDPEVERRLALSKAINGDRVGALKVLDPQLRRQDRAGWRTRAFVLALTGDTKEAMDAVEAAMPGSRAGEMEPFLARLPQLSLAERAMAVHFGRFPKNAQYSAVVPTPTPMADRSSSTLTAGRPDSSQASLGRARADQGDSRKADRTSARKAEKEAARIAVTEEKLTPRRPLPSVDIRAPIGERMADSEARARATAAASEPVVVARRDSIPAPAMAVPLAQPPAAEPTLPPAPMQMAIQQANLRPSDVAIVEAPAQPQPPSKIEFADVAAAIAALPSSDVQQDGQPEMVGEKPKAAAAKTAPAKTIAAKTAEGKADAGKAAPAKTKSTRKAEPAPPKDPSRIWVQLAAAQDAKAFPTEYKRLKAKAPKLLGDKTAWTAPLRATNRLLIGPFKTDKEARDLVNALSKANISSYSWTSDTGQAIEKLPAK